MGVISLELFCVIDYLWTNGRRREVQRAIYNQERGDVGGLRRQTVQREGD